MCPNHEGFLHPVIDVDKCVECRACESACPGLSPAQNPNSEPKTFIVQHKDALIRYQSTSGGAFTAIAEEIIRRGGVVFGAVMTDDFIVRHEAVENNQDLAKFRNSKYVQSEIGDSYNKTKTLLDEGRYVCFSGTPCQINGLHKLLGKEYEKLISVDVVCRSVPSPLVFRKYLDFKMEEEGALSDIVFRDKKRGYLYSTLAHYKSHEAKAVSKDVYRRGGESDEWLRLFMSGKISRRSCMTCPFQTTKRVGDFSLSDAWETGVSAYDDNKGTTIIQVWTTKGLAFLRSLENDVKINSYPQGKHKGMDRTKIFSLQPDRDKLFEDAKELPAKVFFKKYSSYSLLICIKQVGRYLIWKMNLHNVIRRLIHK